MINEAIGDETDHSDYDSNITIPKREGRPRKHPLMETYRKKDPELCIKRGRKRKYETEEQRLEAKKEHDRLAYLRRLEREKLYKDFYTKMHTEMNNTTEGCEEP